MIQKLHKRIGVLRTSLLVSTAIITPIGPFVDGTVYLHDWRLLPSVIAPSLMLILAFVLPLEIVMSSIFMTDADPEKKDRLASAIKAESILFVVMIAAWTPFMFKVLELWPFA